MSQTYLLELTAGALDLHDTRLELNRNVGRNFEIQILVDGKHRGLLYFCVSIRCSCVARTAVIHTWNKRRDGWEEE